MIYFADEDLPDPHDPFGYLAEDERYLCEGPLRASSVLGVAITEPMATAARAFLRCPDSERPSVLEPLAEAATKHETPFVLVLRAALGPPCAVCDGAIEGRFIPHEHGAVHEGCEPGPQLNMFAALERRGGALR